MTSCKLKNSTKGQSTLKLLEVVLVVVVETEKHQSSKNLKNMYNKILVWCL